MFKRVVRSGNISPVFFAEMRCYVVARDEEKYTRWTLGAAKRLNDFVAMSKAESEKNKGKAKATDLFSGTLNIAKEEIGFGSKLPSREKPGDYFEVPYVVGFCTGVRYFAGTRSGRPLTDEERKSLAESAKKTFEFAATMAGAIYMECEIDGKKSVWFDNESCYEPCEISADKLAKPNWMDELARALKSRGFDLEELKADLDDITKDLKDLDSSELTGEDDKKLREELLGFTKGIDEFFKKISNI